jgi:hypothetical protein
MTSAVLAACGGTDPAAEADKQLRSMSDLLSGTQGFQVTARQELVLANDTTETRTAVLAVQRPGKMLAETDVGGGTQTTVFDGKTVQIIFSNEKVWASLEAPATIDAMIDMLADKYETHIFLADLLAASPYDSLMVENTTGQSVEVELDGESFHHLSFSNETVDWQLWIPVLGAALPKKFEIDYKENESFASFTAYFDNWNLEPDLGAEAFVADIPDDFEQIEYAERRVE